MKRTEPFTRLALFAMSAPAVLCLLVCCRVKRERRIMRQPPDALAALTPDSAFGSAGSDLELAAD